MYRQGLSPPKGAGPRRRQWVGQGESVASLHLGFELGLLGGAAEAGPNQRCIADGYALARMGGSRQPGLLSAEPRCFHSNCSTERQNYHRDQRELKTEPWRRRLASLFALSGHGGACNRPDSPLQMLCGCEIRMPDEFVRGCRSFDTLNINVLQSLLLDASGEERTKECANEEP